MALISQPLTSILLSKALSLPVSRNVARLTWHWLGLPTNPHQLVFISEAAPLAKRALVLGLLTAAQALGGKLRRLIRPEAPR